MSNDTNEIRTFTSNIENKLELSWSESFRRAQDFMDDYQLDMHSFDRCSLEDGKAMRMYLLLHYESLLEEASKKVSQDYKNTDKPWTKTFITCLLEQLQKNDIMNDMVIFLNDSRYTNSAGFVLRRFLLKNASKPIKDIIGKHKENMTTMEENVPWPDDLIDEVADEIVKETDSIEKNIWIEWLKDKYAPDQKEIYKIAFVLHMDIINMEKLQNAAGENPFNPRDPEQFIDFFCLNHRDEYSPQEVERLLRRWREIFKTHKESDVLKSAPEIGFTQTNRRKIDEAAGSTDTIAQQEDDLMKYMENNINQFQGFSLSNRKRILYFLNYLRVFFPSYPDKYGNMVEVSVWNDGYPKSVDLFKAINLYNIQKRNAIDSSFYDLEDHIGQIRRSLNMKTKENPRNVTRKEVLELFIFFVCGYMRAEEGLLESFNRKSINIIKPQPEDDVENDFYEKIFENVIPYMYSVRKLKQFGEAEPTECFRELRDAANSLLEIFGFLPLYVPNPFDRFICLWLMAPSFEEFGDYVFSTKKKQITPEQID